MDQQELKTNRFTPLAEAAKIIKANPETLRRWIREGKIPKNFYRKETTGEKIEYLICRSWAQKKSYEGVEILIEFKIFKELIAKIKPSTTGIEEFFGDDPGCIVAIIPGGVAFALSLLFFLIDKGKDITLVCIREENPYDTELVEGTKVLIVDNPTRTGKTLEEAIKEVKRKNLEMKLKIKKIKTFVYADFAKKADFWVEQPDHHEFLNSIKLNLKLKK